ncbi:MAG TPA: glycoside hydrolase family 3 protein [Burkholderiaceae bacterium]|jgi:beta-glucosidase
MLKTPLKLTVCCALLGVFNSVALATQPGPIEADAWPTLKPHYAPDPALEARIKAIVAGMTLEQKIGQMTQPEIQTISADEVKRYYIGSVLNGGGSWPGLNKHSSAADWLKLATAYRDASTHTDMAVQIPLIWGTDAIHGDSNIFGATLFPHNMALGAAHDPALIKAIGQSTAKTIRATGIDWAFAPTLAVTQDMRWGRSYESFSSDPALVHAYAAAYIEGLQGDFKSDENVIATAKHFMGDGGTHNGVDQGINQYTRADMIKTHGQGYYAAIEAGVQTVMASFNSWNDVAAGEDHGKMHGNRSMLTGVLKERLGFDGFVVSDWDGIGQVPGCSNADCPQAINAGVDMIMVSKEWRAFIANTVKDVQEGRIPMARIDDAVSRILRVKLRAGIFDHTPAQSRVAGRQDALSDKADKALARRAVRESLVLLKNEGQVLPLAPKSRVLVVGKSADSMPNQNGGWSITWQGDKISNADFPNGDTVLGALRKTLGDKAVVYDETGTHENLGYFDAVIAVLGEKPYAEGAGDIKAPGSLQHSSRYPEDIAALKAVAGRGKPVVTVFMSGRVLEVNDLLNRSDAFVVAWLPGTEGLGVTDLLVQSRKGKPRYDFTGRLPFSWPREACQFHIEPGKALAERGQGLSLDSKVSLPALPETSVPTCAD